MITTTPPTEPGPTWLDRLRSSRGFPTGSEPNLDRSLSSSSSATRSESTHFTRRLDFSSKNTTNLAGDVSDVLSDLFHFGEEPSRTFSKKNSRKQSNPRFFNHGSLVSRVRVDREYPLPIINKKRNCRKQANPRFFDSGDLIGGNFEKSKLKSKAKSNPNSSDLNCWKQLNPRLFDSGDLIGGEMSKSNPRLLNSCSLNRRKQLNPKLFDSGGLIGGEMSNLNCRKQLNPRLFDSGGLIGGEMSKSNPRLFDSSGLNCRKQLKTRLFDSGDLIRGENADLNPRLLNSEDLIGVDHEYPLPIVETGTKKNSRKQPNPRFFNSEELASKNDDLCSSDDLRREKSENLLLSSGDNSLNDKIQVQNNEDKSRDDIGCDNNGSEGEGEGEDEEEVIDMKEFTRSEVTVVDTSFDEWKSDKWVFRKKDEWKIKDKSKKSKSVSRKRKLLLDENGGEMIKEKKIMHLNQPENDKARELLLMEAAKFVGNLPQSRFPCPRPPEKLRIESSPVILLKSIPTSDNVNGIIRLGKSAKKGRPKKMII